MADTDVLIVEQERVARVLTFNRPETLNSLGGEELMPAALEMAERIGANPSRALAMAKWGLQRAQYTDFDTSIDWVNYAMTNLRASDEHKDAVKAFVEDRAARRQASQS